MNLPPKFVEALEIIDAGLSGINNTWGITGSVGMALQGMDLEVHDIDLQSDQAGVYAMQDRLKAYVTQPVWLRESEKIRSFFAVLEIAGVKVEMMGDMQNRLPDGRWGAVAQLSPAIRWVDYHSMRLPVLDLEYEHQAYLRMERFEKAEKMRQFMAQRKEPE